MHRSILVSTAFTIFSVAACNSSPSASSDLGVVSDSAVSADLAFQVAAHPAWPQVINAGGPILKNISIVTITWAADPLSSQLQAFDAWLPKSAYYTESLAEYGVFAGAQAATWAVPTPAPALLDDAGVHKLLNDAIASGAVPPANADRLYAIYPPQGTAVMLDGTTACSGFQAIHDSFPSSAPGGAAVVMMIAPRCDPGTMTALDFVTWGASHEIAEAATDPQPVANPSWSTTDLLLPNGGEIGDLCLGFPLPVEGHTVTALWSNKAAAVDQRTCVPAPSGPMFGAFTSQSQVSIPAGGSAMIPVSLYATAPVSDLYAELYAYDPKLKVSATQPAHNGDTLMFTVSAPAGYKTPAGGVTIALYALTKEFHTATYLTATVP